MQCRHSLVVELQLPKLAVRVRFPLPAPKILQKRILFLQYFLSKSQTWYIISPVGLDIINNGKALLYIITL